jgi:hypothetical protein
LFPPDDERLSLETCRGRRINTLKKVNKVRQVGQDPQGTVLFGVMPGGLVKIVVSVESPASAFR